VQDGSRTGRLNRLLTRYSRNAEVRKVWKRFPLRSRSGAYMLVEVQLSGINTKGATFSSTNGVRSAADGNTGKIFALA
jgi:hypothetical protein